MSPPTSPPPSLRSLTSASAHAVARLHLAAREAYYAVQPDTSGPTAQTEDYARMWHGRLGREDWQLTGAYSGGDLVGFTAVQLPAAQLQCVAHPLRPGALHLVALYVDPGCWDAGIGSLLYDAVEAALVLTGYSRAELEVWSLNHRARGFYARRGWEVDGRIRPAHAGTDYLGMVLRSPSGS